MFQVDFVICDTPPPQSKLEPIYDNNNQTDFKLLLKDGPTEQQIIQSRLEALKKQVTPCMLLLSTCLLTKNHTRMDDSALLTRG